MTIVSLSVRYKSATVEEFIEKHAADVSGHGIFVKTDRAFALGTLLQLDVRIADKQTLIAGVGRVVWRREAALGADRPVGVGVQFLRIDKSSRAMIDRLVTAKPNAGRRYEAEAEGVQAPADGSSQALPNLPELTRPSRPTGPQPPGAARAKPGWHKTTLMGVGVGQSAASPTPGPGPVLPRPAAPPRRATPSVIPPPPVTLPSKLLADLDQEPEDLTLIGDAPEMPEERKTTLVGVGAAVVVAPRLPPPVAPPQRPNALMLTPFGPPVRSSVPPVPVPTAPLATDSAPMVRESDIEVASELPPDTEDEPEEQTRMQSMDEPDEPEEETRMQSMDDLLDEVAASAPPPVATAPMLPVEPPAPMFPIDDDPMFPIETDAPPAVEKSTRAPLPAAPLPPARVPLPLVLPPREQFVPTMPLSTHQGMVTVQTRVRPMGAVARAAAASARDKAIAAAGAGLLVLAAGAFLFTHPWSTPAPDPPREQAAPASTPHAPSGWSKIQAAPETTAAATIPPSGAPVPAPTMSAMQPAPTPVAPPPPFAPPPQVAPPPPVAPETVAAPPPRIAPPAPIEAPVAPASAPAPASPPPRPRPQSTPAPAPTPTPSPAAAPPAATTAPPAPVAASHPAPKPAAAPSRPVKPSVDDGF